VVFRPDSTVQDGRFANLAWLQELPKPFTKVTWENTISMSLATAAELKVKAFGETQSVDEVELTVNGRKVRGAAMVLPGLSDGTVLVSLGYGRRRCGRVAVGEGHPGILSHKIGGSHEGILGYDAYEIQSVASPAYQSGAELKTTGNRLKIAQTQLHFNLDDPGITSYAGKMADHESVSLQRRGIIRTAALNDYRKDPEGIHRDYHTPGPRESFTDGAWQYKGYAWGMAIDTNVCNGCNACVVACQAENNIPVVGKEQVRKQREMHWLRVDQYYMGSVENPKMFAMPLPCMHCENAPCELVCPVAATVHSDEGTNDMVYNRCVGTRFCANNCPYKVRRFNWFQYTDWSSPLAKMLRNPEVTPRSRGVMEKCTFCIQRIAVGRIEAENDGRKVRDGEIVTACQATCPSDAIVFGNINDPESRVTRLKRLQVNYSLLAELNTRPRVTYLAAIRNPNPEIEEA
jgi:molybdopterin-containing oxidoreductase family iron-sulfur binding subunit